MICNFYKSISAFFCPHAFKNGGETKQKHYGFRSQNQNPFGTVPKANSTFGVERKLEKLRVDKMFQFRHLKETRQTIEHLFNVITLGNTTS